MSSPFAQAATLVDTMTSHASLLTTTRIHPGSGDTADAADALAQDVAQRAIQVEDWLVETRALCETQSRADDILSAAPKPADLEAWHEKWSALPEGEQREAEMKAWLHDAAKRQEALTTHTAETITDIPALPEGMCTVPVDSLGGEVSPTESPEKDSADGDRLGDEEGTAPESGSTDEKPVTMSTGTPETPVTMSTGTERATPAPVSDTAAGTELSSSTVTDSAARPSLSGQMASTQGQGTPQVSAAGQPAGMGGVPVSQQLSQPARGGAGASGTAPRSPQQRREEQDKRDEKDATVQAISGVGLAGASGAMTAAAMAPNTPSPGTTTSGAPSAPVTPSATNPAPQGAPPAGGGAGMAGMGRGAPLGSGNGISPVKPVISAEQPPTPTLTPEEQRLLDAYNKDGKK